MNLEPRTTKSAPILVVALIAVAFASPVDAEKRKPKEFRDGVYYYEYHDYAKTVTLMREALEKEPEDDGAYVVSESLPEPRIYVPNFYLGAALVRGGSTGFQASNCSEAMAVWARLSPEALEGAPQAEKDRIAQSWRELNDTCVFEMARQELEAAEGERTLIAHDVRDADVEPAATLPRTPPR